MIFGQIEIGIFDLIDAVVRLRRALLEDRLTDKHVSKADVISPKVLSLARHEAYDFFDS